MPFVIIDGAVTFSSNNGVMLEPDALKLEPSKLYELVSLAFSHLNDEILLEACHGGRGPLADYFKLTYEQYLQCLETARIEDAGIIAKRLHTKVRRTDYNAKRSQLILKMLDAGVPYICADQACDVTEDLTIDHIIPLSRGGTDELENLRFMCRSHNSKKRDRPANIETCKRQKSGTEATE